MGWAERILGDKLNTKDIYIIQVPIYEHGGMVFPPAPFKK